MSQVTSLEAHNFILSFSLTFQRTLSDNTDGAKFWLGNLNMVTNIMLESNQKLNGKNVIHGNNKFLQSLSTGVLESGQIGIGKRNSE